MLRGTDLHAEVARLRERAALAATRAARAGARAAHHERRAREGGAGQRQSNRSLAQLHRESRDRHLVTAGLYMRYARELEERAGSTGAGTTQLIRSVAGACGRCGVFVNLCVKGDTPMVLVSDATARAVHDAEVLLGEGPSAACPIDGPLLIRGDEIRRRWPSLAAAAEPFGLRAVATVPLEMADFPIGSLTAVATSPDGYIEVGLNELGAMGDAVLEELVAEVGAPGLARIPLLDRIDCKDELHQAVGMVAARCDCSTGDAFALLRARAFSTGTDLGSLARAIISGDAHVEW